MERLKLLATAFSLAALLGSSALAQEYPTRVYRGDTHNHTGNSFDVYLSGTPTSIRDTDFRFANLLRPHL